MKLQPIERGPGGSLPRMTAAQRKRANALIRNTCCNYESGHCFCWTMEMLVHARRQFPIPYAVHGSGGQSCRRIKH